MGHTILGKWFHDPIAHGDELIEYLPASFTRSLLLLTSRGGECTVKSGFHWSLRHLRPSRHLRHTQQHLCPTQQHPCPTRHLRHTQQYLCPTQRHPSLTRHPHHTQRHPCPTQRHPSRTRHLRHTQRHPSPTRYLLLPQRLARIMAIHHYPYHSNIL